MRTKRRAKKSIGELRLGRMAAEVVLFVHTGSGEGAVVPEDVVHVRIDPTVLVIPANLFLRQIELRQVEIQDGLHEIGDGAFYRCTALRELQLSDGVESIGDNAFYHCTALRKVQLSDGVERIGRSAFVSCNFAKFRCPPLVTTITFSMLAECKGMFSLEMPENTIRLEHAACNHCHSLRNVAIAMNTVVDEKAFFNCSDLLHIFGTQQAIVNALRHRFNRFPVHSKMYYLSYYNQTTMEEIRNAITIGEHDKLDPTGLQQDCVGMTPLHILACSTVQRLELYQLMIEKYLENLIVKDSWGAEPLLYAVWGDAPNEIVYFLVNSYQSLYSNYEFD